MNRNYQQPSPATPPPWATGDRMMAAEWRLSTVERDVDHLRLTVHGQDGSNGLRGIQRQQAADIGLLQAWQADLLMQFRLACRLARWAGVTALVIYGSLGASPTVEWLASLVSNARRIVGG